METFPKKKRGCETMREEGEKYVSQKKTICICEMVTFLFWLER